MQVFSDSFQVTSRGIIAAYLGDRKIQYSSTQSDDNYLHRPLEMPAEFDWNTPFGLTLKAEEMLKQRNYEQAIDYYLQCLKKDSNYLDALVGLAELYYRKLDYEKALKYEVSTINQNIYWAYPNSCRLISAQCLFGHFSGSLTGSRTSRLKTGACPCQCRHYALSLWRFGGSRIKAFAKNLLCQSLGFKDF